MHLEVSRRTDLALRAVRAVHAADGPVSGRALAEQLETSPTYLAQAVAPVVAHGWLASRSGPNGGYLPTAATASLSVLQVLEAVEGEIDDAQCVLAGGPCGTDRCAMHEAWCRGRAALRAALATEPAVG